MDSSAYTRFVRNRALKSNTAVRTAPGVSQEMVVGRRTGGQALVLNRHVINAECCSQKIVPPSPPPITEGIRLTFTPQGRNPGLRDITSNYLYVYVTNATGTITDNLGNSVTIDSPDTETLYTLETFGSTVSLNFFSAASITIAGANDQIMAVEVFDIPGIAILQFNGDLRDEIDLRIDPSTISSVVFHNMLTSLNSLLFNYVTTTFTSLDVLNIPNINALIFGAEPDILAMIGTYEISQITNLSNLGLLGRIIFRDCKFTELDLRGLSTLNNIICINNSLLQSLNVSGLTALTGLQCQENQLTSLDVSGSTALSLLKCYSNQLTSLNITGLSALTFLECSINQLESLDVGGLTALSFLDCAANQLESLDVSGLSTITYLSCRSNKLTSLNVSGLTALTFLDCAVNNLESLDVGDLTALTYLNCTANQQLSSLDVSGLYVLSSLYCSDTQLTSLNISTNTELIELYCDGTQINQLNADAIAADLDANGQEGGTFQIINIPSINPNNTINWINLANKGWSLIT